MLHCFRMFLATAIFLCTFTECLCQVVYVNNIQGNDSLNGYSSEALGGHSGPVRTIGRAFERVRQGGTIVIANNGVPYYESLQMMGKNGSGFQGRPLRIIGNGVIIDGSKPVPPKAWRQRGVNLWSFRPRRKGFYQLILNGEAVPEFVASSTVKKLSEIPIHKWAARKGEIFYRADIGEFPFQNNFRFACHRVGLTLYNVHDVEIKEMTFRYFQLDGVSAHSLCRHLKFSKIRSHGNGRSGFFAGGTSDVTITGSQLKNNRKASLLIRGLAVVKLQEAETDSKPQFIK